MKKILFFLLLFNLNIISVFALSNPYSQYETLTKGEDNQKITLVNCGWYAWKMAKENANVELPFFGNAVTWYEKAKNAGYSVGYEARPNSIVVYNTSSPSGHVAYVTRVDGYYMYINEAGMWYRDKVISDECTPSINALGEEDCIYGATITYKPMNGNGIVNNNKVLSSGSRTEDEGSSKIIGFIYLSEPRKEQSNVTTKQEVKEESSSETIIETTTTIKETTKKEKTTSKKNYKKINDIKKQNNKSQILITGLLIIFMLASIVYKAKNKKR